MLWTFLHNPPNCTNVPAATTQGRSPRANSPPHGHTTHCPFKVGGHLSFDREALTIETAGP